MSMAVIFQHRRTVADKKFFNGISQSYNCLHHLLPPPRHTELVTRLRHTNKYPIPFRAKLMKEKNRLVLTKPFSFNLLTYLTLAINKCNVPCTPVDNRDVSAARWCE